MSIVETNVFTISKNQQRLLFFIVSHTILVFAYKQKKCFFYKISTLREGRADIKTCDYIRFVGEQKAEFYLVEM